MANMTGILWTATVRGRNQLSSGSYRVKADELIAISAARRRDPGPANLRLAMVEACVFYSLIGFLDPSIPIQMQPVSGVVRVRRADRP